MGLPNAVEGARHTAISITWSDEDGAAVDLTSATLTGYKYNLVSQTAVAIDGTLTLSDATNGVFSWAYGAVDVGTVASFMVQIIATFADGSKDKTIHHSWAVLDAFDT